MAPLATTAGKDGEDGEEDKLGGGHDVPASARPEPSEEEKLLLAKVMEHVQPVAEYPREGNLYVAEVELSSVARQGPAN